LRNRAEIGYAIKAVIHNAAFDIKSLCATQVMGAQTRNKAAGYLAIAPKRFLAHRVAGAAVPSFRTIKASRTSTGLLLDSEIPAEVTELMAAQPVGLRPSQSAKKRIPTPTGAQTAPTPRPRDYPQRDSPPTNRIVDKTGRQRCVETLTV